MGCTKKHAKCSWKDVEEQELKDHPFVARVKAPDEGMDTGSDGDGRASGSGTDVATRGGQRRKDAITEKVGVRDEELLGEESGDEDVELDKEPERQHSVQSMSPPTITVTKEMMHGRIEPLQPLRDTQPPASTQQQRDIEHSDPIATTTREGYITLSEPVSENETTKSTPASYPPYQAPQAQMLHNPTPEHNGTKEHFQTQYERDIYSQLNEATREHAEPVGMYTASSEPLQSHSSPTQQQIETTLTTTQLAESRSTETQEEPSQSYQTAPMQTEQLPSPPLQSQDLQSSQVPNGPFAGQTMQN